LEDSCANISYATPADLDWFEDDADSDMPCPCRIADAIIRQ